MLKISKGKIRVSAYPEFTLLSLDRSLNAKISIASEHHENRLFFAYIASLLLRKGFEQFRSNLMNSAGSNFPFPVPHSPFALSNSEFRIPNSKSTFPLQKLQPIPLKRLSFQHPIPIHPRQDVLFQKPHTVAFLAGVEGKCGSGFQTVIELCHYRFPVTGNQRTAGISPILPALRTRFDRA